MPLYNVHIPEESYVILRYKISEIYAIGVVNIALKGFEPKEVFAWHLALTIEFDEIANNGMPTPDENEIVNEFGEYLDALIKGGDLQKPNALFLARETWTETRQLIWRVFEPETVHRDLQKILEDKTYPRPFEYKMELDEDWKKTEWFLQDHKLDKSGK